jgi:hypothetical protein
VNQTTVVRRGEVSVADADVVVIDRSTRWGNRFTTHASRAGYRIPGMQSSTLFQTLELVPDRAAAVEAHRIEFLQRLSSAEGPELRAWLDSIRGKRLACHCAPLPCHGDTYAELADMEPSKLERLIRDYAA